MKRGNEVLISFPDLGRKIKGKLDYSGQSSEPLLFNVEVRLNPKDGLFHPNMVAVLKIADYSSPKAFVLPLASVQKSSDAEFVYVSVTENGKKKSKRKL